MTETETAIKEPTGRGEVVTHGTDEDSGTDVGYHIGLGGGATLWVGEISKDTWDDLFADTGLSNKDFGWWIVLYRKGEKPLPLGRALTAYEVSDTIYALCAALKRP